MNDQWADNDEEQVTDHEDLNLDFPWWTYRVLYGLAGVAAVGLTFAALIVAGDSR